MPPRLEVYMNLYKVFAWIRLLIEACTPGPRDTSQLFHRSRSLFGCIGCGRVQPLNTYTQLIIFTMNLRQRAQVIILLFLILVTFASYHKGTGSTTWLQWLTVVTLAAFTLVFDLAFTNDSQFIFDPDAENWRRKTVSRLEFL